MQKKRKPDSHKIHLLFGFMLLFLGIALIWAIQLYTKPAYLGGVIGLAGEQKIKAWDFSNPSEYLFDLAEINLSSNEAKLNAFQETKTFINETLIDSSVILALYNSEDKTSKIQELDNETINIKEGKTLNLTFDMPLALGDIISFYIKSTDETDIYLCDASCMQNFGTIHLNANGWYNFTINNLQDANADFVIKINEDSHEPTKIDQIKALHKNIATHQDTNITYPAYGKIETFLFTADNFDSWGAFEATYSLNGQEIDYSYSTDNATWTNMQSGDILNINLASIILRAELKSNLSETPVLYNISIAYFISNTTGTTTTLLSNETTTTTLPANETTTTTLPDNETTTTTIIENIPSPEPRPRRRSESLTSPVESAQPAQAELASPPAQQPTTPAQPTETDQPAEEIFTRIPEGPVGQPSILDNVNNGVRTITGNVIANVKNPNRLILSILAFVLFWFGIGLFYYLVKEISN